MVNIEKTNELHTYYWVCWVHVDTHFYMQIISSPDTHQCHEYWQLHSSSMQMTAEYSWTTKLNGVNNWNKMADSIVAHTCFYICTFLLEACQHLAWNDVRGRSKHSSLPGDCMCACVKRENLTELVGKSVTLSKLLAAVFAIIAGSSVTALGSSVGLDPVGNGQEAGMNSTCVLLLQLLAINLSELRHWGRNEACRSHGKIETLKSQMLKD